MYFNPRLREGGDLITGHNKGWVNISIHASAREATFTIYLQMLYRQISIHASAREATCRPVA